MSSLFQGLVDTEGRVRTVNSSTSPTGVVPFRGMYITPDGQVIATPDTGQSRVSIVGIAFEDPSGILLTSQGAGPWTTVPGGVLVDAAGAVKIDSATPVDVIHQGVGLLNDGTLCVSVDVAFGPELCSNSTFNQWTNDDPDGFEIAAAEDAGNYVTEVPNGCRIVTDGGLMGIRWSENYNTDLYALEVDVESISGSWYLGFFLSNWSTPTTNGQTITQPGTYRESFAPSDLQNAGVKRNVGFSGEIILSRFSIRQVL